MNRNNIIKDEEENMAVEEFRDFFEKFAKKISADPEFQKHENKLKAYGIRVIEINAKLHQDDRAKITH